MASSTMPNLLNHTVELRGRRYKLEQVLGEGTYGVVYRGRDRASPEDAPEYRAVKIVRKDVPGRSGVYELLQREIALHHAASGHPNVVTLYDTAESDEYVLFLLDYCPGGDLYTQIADNRVFAGNDELIKKVFVQVLDAVDHCHERGVYHRDLKPENILCDRDGSHVYLADFGLATDRTFSVNHGCGTAFYISPECIGKRYGYAPYWTRGSDIWSLAVILFTMIADCYPWDKPSMEDPAFQQYMEDPFFFYCALPISPAAAAIFDRAFDPNPLARFSIPELREAVLNIDTFFKKGTKDERAEETKSMSINKSAQACEKSDEPLPLDASIEREEADVSLLASNSEVLQKASAAAELDMPELSDAVSYSCTSSAGDDLATPESGINDGTCASSIDPRALGKALMTLSLRQKYRKTPRLPAPWLFEKFRLGENL
ncbi:kinase-like protein [Obba rivulosa]|uniref:non-specific serine/threonine protein kinase n=1 Tax=Obba rivulosa TaxID=1052685 RepID=A0A8E2APV5_9APHY|nr:kinase-like protein [Obba rivulosa]